MEEKVIVLVENKYESRKEALLKIGEELDFSHFNGNNLDAFYDCLSEIFYPVTFVIVPDKKYGCKGWMHEICITIKELSEERKLMKVVCANIDNIDEYHSAYESEE